MIQEDARVENNDQSNANGKAKASFTKGGLASRKIWGKPLLEGTEQ